MRVAATSPSSVPDVDVRSSNASSGTRTWGAYQHYGRANEKLLPVRNVNRTPENTA